MNGYGLTFYSFFFFFNDPATTEIYTLSLHDALPNSCAGALSASSGPARGTPRHSCSARGDRKSTRLNSSHEWSSYADFCLNKKNSICVDCRIPNQIQWSLQWRCPILGC